MNRSKISKSLFFRNKIWDGFFYEDNRGPCVVSSNDFNVESNYCVAPTKFISYLKSLYGARFYKIKINKLPIRSFGGNWVSNQTEFDNYPYDYRLFTVDPKLDIKIWQEWVRRFVFLNILSNQQQKKEGLNFLELAEFFYFNIKNLQILYYTNKKDDGAPGSKIFKSFDIEMLLVIRSIVGSDLTEQFDKNIMGSRECNDRFSLTPLTEEEATSFYKELISYFPDSYKEKCYSRGYDFLNARQYLHGWHWFRNYSSINKTLPELADVEPYYSDLLETVKDEWSRASSACLGWNGVLHTDFIANPFVYSSYSTTFLLDEYTFDDTYSTYEISDLNLYHPHSEILGLNVESTYDSPAVLFNLIKSYCILNRIHCIENTLYRLQNNSFFQPLGSLSWFKNNISTLMQELAEEFPISFSVIDQPLLLSKQLRNVIELIETDSKLLFKEVQR